MSQLKAVCIKEKIDFYKKQERVCSLKDRLGGGLYIDIFSVKNVGIESIYRKMPYKKTLFLLYFWLLLGF